MELLGFFLQSRIGILQDTALRLVPRSKPFKPSASAVRVLCAGDMSFDTEYRFPPGVILKRKSVSLPLRIRRGLKRRMAKFIFSPRLFSGEIDVDVNEIKVKTEDVKKKTGPSYVYDTCTMFSPPPAPERYAYPFEKISPLMREKDLVFANLENPLSDNKRVTGFFRSEPGYGHGMKKSGVSIVSIANNHIFDAGEIGFLDTMKHLDDSGIKHVGGGANLETARRGKALIIKDTKIHFLAYTQFCNSNFTSAANNYPGIMPLDIDLALEDIEKARLESNFVFVSIHWGYENQPNVHPKQVEIAHDFIDAGADCIIGHHSHVPHGIEIYRGRPILYSLGNFIFGYYKSIWGENLLAEIVIQDKKISGVLVYPISGREEQMQPRILNGRESGEVLREIRIKSAVFRTPMAVRDGIGYIRIGK